MKPMLILLSLIALSGCATEAKLNAKLDGWVGRPAIELVRQAGPPQKILDGPNGHKWYVYHHENTYVTKRRVNYDGYGNATISGGNTLIGYCTMSFEVNAKDIIAGWHKKGDECVAM